MAFGLHSGHDSRTEISRNEQPEALLRAGAVCSASMPPDDPFDDLERSFIKDDGRAAREHLAAGQPVYYGDAHYPDALVRKWPDGAQQLVTINLQNEVTVLRQL